MPVGFEKQIKPEGFADLLAFLTKRGKFVPLSLEKVATAVSTKGMFTNENNDVERLVFADWRPEDGPGRALLARRSAGRPRAERRDAPRRTATAPCPQKMPKSVSLSMGSPIKALHILGGVAGWGFPAGGKGSTSMLVRFTYPDGAVGGPSPRQRRAHRRLHPPSGRATGATSPSIWPDGSCGT
jgi:uncharacterized protein